MKHKSKASIDRLVDHKATPTTKPLRHQSTQITIHSRLANEEQLCCFRLWCQLGGGQKVHLTPRAENYTILTIYCMYQL